ncbi:MAG TPA: hypothetical protein VHO68_03995 [Bacteroidales bacterium]|nr:hypothetical protein [Bacteroidales bacterium]
MEDFRNNSSQNLGIAALITAIITFVLAVIPCVGLIAIIPGIIAVVLASVGLSQASRNNSPKGVLIAGLIIAIVAVMISFSQIFIAGRLANRWPKNIENIVNDVQDNVLRELEDKNVNIKIESNGESIEINSTKKEDVKVLEDLEGVGSKDNDTTKVSK